MEEIVMGLIVHAGAAKEHIYEALKLTKEGKYEESDREVELAEESIHQSHNIQTQWLTKEAAGEGTEISAIFVHAQDHLMTTMTEMNVIKEIIDLRRELADKALQ